MAGAFMPIDREVSQPPIQWDAETAERPSGHAVTVNQAGLAVITCLCAG